MNLIKAMIYRDRDWEVTVDKIYSDKQHYAKKCISKYMIIT